MNLAAFALASVLAPAPAAPAVTSGGPYCGIYCVYSAARMLGKPADFAALLDRRYVGSYKGSTAAELQRAAADLGLSVTAMSGLTASSLRASRHPVLLHVRRPGRKMPFAHWVLFAGVEGGRARVIDPPAGVELVPFAELAALWDGVGLVVSAEPASTAGLRLAGWAEAAALLAAVTAALGAARLATSGRPVGPAWGAAGLLALAACVGAGVHALGPDGLYRNRAALGLVSAQHFRPDIPELGVGEARALLAAGAVAVDARVPADYAAGHLPGAASLPVYAGLAERRAVSDAIPAGAPVVVYCQSEGCVWADSVAADLYHRGHTNISIMRGGWRGWAGDE